MRVLLIFALITWIANRVEESNRSRTQKFEDRPKEFRSVENLEERNQNTTTDKKSEIRQMKLEDIRTLLLGEELEKEAEEIKEQEPLISSEHSMESTSKEDRPKRERMAKIKFQDNENSSYKEYDYSAKKSKRKKYSRDEMKKDIIKGFIFSEILAEPKSIRNKNESI